MWAAGRNTFGLSEEEFWQLSIDQWIALNKENEKELKIYDLMNARLCATVAASAPFRKGKPPKEDVFRVFQEEVRNKPAKDPEQIKSFFLNFMYRHNTALESGK